ncbi:hypothetical protein PG989_001992 [Apiospora arundinis]
MELNDRTLFPTTNSTYMGGNVPGNAYEPVCYFGGPPHLQGGDPGCAGFHAGVRSSSQLVGGSPDTCGPQVVDEGGV